jgi:hypothetical protein
MDAVNVPHDDPVKSRQERKVILVELGLWCLAHGHWDMVHAITCIIERERLTHE